MGRMIKRFDLDKDNISIESLVETGDSDIINEIINGIFYGIAKGEERVDLFEIAKGFEVQVFFISRNEWKKALNRCMEAMIAIEEYETCSEIKKAISILEK